MTIGKYFTIGVLLLLSCGTKKTQTSDYTENLDTSSDTVQIEVPIATEAWMNFDTVEQVSYVDLYQYDRLKIPGKWKHADSQPPRYFSYENSEYHVLQLDRGILDTMKFYQTGITDTELLNRLYDQGTTLWKEKNVGQILTIETNSDNVIAKLTIKPTEQIFLLCGVKKNKTMTLYLVPKTPDDKKNVDLLKKVFIGWRQK